MALMALRGKSVMMLDATWSGIENTLGCESLFAWREEIVRIASAGSAPCGALKKLAVKVVL